MGPAQIVAFADLNQLTAIASFDQKRAGVAIEGEELVDVYQSACVIQRTQLFAICLSSAYDATDGGSLATAGLPGSLETRFQRFGVLRGRWADQAPGTQQGLGVVTACATALF